MPRPVAPAGIILTVLVAGAVPADARTAPEPSSPQTIVVFLGDGSSFATGDFLGRPREGLASLAEEMGVEMELRPVAEGAPEEIRVTPLIVYQNSRGRSIYQGRYSNLDRIRNFVRTSRVIPQTEAEQLRRDLPAWKVGRATVATPIKVTGLTGDVPDGHDAAAFAATATRAIAEGMERFEMAERAAIGRSDRMFYLDVHPYLEAGLLFLSCELYSQFNCHDPIWSGLDDPIVGFWEDREALLADAGARLEDRLLEQVERSPRGDAFEPVAESVEEVSWESIGLELPPEGSRRRAGGDASIEVPRRWTVVPPAPEEPPVLFRFPPPLDNNAGLARSIAGWIDLDAGAGELTVPVASVTMGDPQLDEVLQSGLFLDARDHPESRFRVDSIALDRRDLRFGTVSQTVMRGSFELKGVTVGIDVRTSLEPVIDGGGGPRLLLTADWNIRLRQPFGLTGPDGPSPSNDTLLLRCQITLKPADGPTP